MAPARKLSLAPPELALLYDFANSLDLRRFVQGGIVRSPHDELATVEALEAWMRRHGLIRAGVRLNRRDHRRALEFRRALRDFVEVSTADRHASDAAVRLNAAAADFPLVVRVSARGGIGLEPEHRGASSGLGRVLAELQRAAETGQLDRLKMCASEECRRVFYDRSKPTTRRWCSSLLCGNRQKTRAYRARQREQGTAD